MSYATQSDLELAAGGAVRFVQLTDWDGDGTADAGVIAQAQAAADGLVDSHLRRFSPGDLAALRATPTDTIKRIAAAEAIFWVLEKRRAITKDDLDLRALRITELTDMRADKLRAADEKTPRATFIDNDSDVSRDGTKGMW
jgi:hypothetical protein